MLWFVGGSVVVISFGVVAAFHSRAASPRAPPPPDAASSPPRRPVAPSAILGLAALALVAAHAGLPPSDLPASLVWIGAWTLLPILAYLLGRDPWRFVNPFAVLGALADRLRGARAPLALPPALGAWPAALLLVALDATEVRAPGSAALGAGALAYAAATLAALLVFGSDAWLARGEPLTVALRAWSATSLAERARGLLGRAPPALPVALALLFATTFDAALATPAGVRASLRLAAAVGGFVPALALLAAAGFALLLVSYAAAVAAVRAAARSRDPLPWLAARFAPALLPIAAGYHFAHYGGALLDAVGLGDARAIGVVQVVAILAGHVGSVVVAHRLAFGVFESRRQAVRSEVPLTALMVVYTFLGLWILTQGVAA